MTARKPDQHIRDVAIVLNNHRLIGGTKFSHHNGQSVVEWPGMHMRTMVWRTGLARLAPSRRARLS